ncbi:transposase [Streptomyces sp. NPDC055036]
MRGQGRHPDHQSNPFADRHRPVGGTGQLARTWRPARWSTPRPAPVQPADWTIRPARSERPCGNTPAAARRSTRRPNTGTGQSGHWSPRPRRGWFPFPGVGPESAGQLLTSAGDNPDRLHSEAPCTHFRGAAPGPDLAGRTNRHRINRGGDRAADNAPCTRSSCSASDTTRGRRNTRPGAPQGGQEGHGRCLEWFVGREIYRHPPHVTRTTKQLPRTA